MGLKTGLRWFRKRIPCWNCVFFTSFRVGIYWLWSLLRSVAGCDGFLISKSSTANSYCRDWDLMIPTNINSSIYALAHCLIFFEQVGKLRSLSRNGQTSQVTFPQEYQIIRIASLKQFVLSKSSSLFIKIRTPPDPQHHTNLMLPKQFWSSPPALVGLKGHEMLVDPNLPLDGLAVQNFDRLRP